MRTIIMNILIVGSGAREHIIAEKIYESKYRPILFCASATINPGIEKMCKNRWRNCRII